ncbi:uncharacterized protein RB166_000485 [Leptodactylus fuscus]|uniref:uncharacterized protein LOC142194904 n=1 Tax=Leptodactylus fuscus TaxID=238119 RepID=UPI003F4E5100
MLKKSLNTDNEPHTLRSDVNSNGISICKPSHLSSLSLASNPLQISQSPTTGFLTGQYETQCYMSRVNPDRQEENRHCGSIPASVNASDLSHTTNQTESVSKIVDKELLSKMESSENTKEKEHENLPPTEDLSVSPCPPGDTATELSHQPSPGSSSHDKISSSYDTFSNIDFGPSSEFVAPSPTALLSDILPSLKFFSFVILHVPEDQDEAERVCGILNSLEIGEGTTFCEGFETAGVSPLTCLEDAIQNSAYIVLLLTTGFLSLWGEFQINTVLMNSIDDKRKKGTVIPFIPKLQAIPSDKIPLGLKSLIPLIETSRLFEKRVRNTFKLDVIKTQQERWTREQVRRALEKKLEDAKDQISALNLQQFIAMDMSTLLSSLPLHLIPGYGSVIHINNSSNVQIGNNNSLNVQQTTNVPQMDCYQE